MSNTGKIKKKFLIVVDMQNDFIYGPLGTAGSERIVPWVTKYVEKCANDPDYKIFFTMDSHRSESYFDTHEGKNLPVLHCADRSEGWDIIPELKPWHIAPNHQNNGNSIIKTSFGSTSWYNIINEYLFEVDPHHYWENEELQFELIGVCTDICVLANAVILRATFSNSEIIVHDDLCAGSNADRHNSALAILDSQQITIKRGLEGLV